MVVGSLAPQVLQNRHGGAPPAAGRAGRAATPEAALATGAWRRPRAGAIPAGAGVLSIIHGFSSGASPCRSTPTAARPAATRRTCCRRFRPAAQRLPGLRRRPRSQAGHRRRLPAQGLGLVRDRLPRRQRSRGGGGRRRQAGAERDGAAASAESPPADGARRPSAEAATPAAGRRRGPAAAPAPAPRRAPAATRRRACPALREEIPDRRPAGLAAAGRSPSGCCSAVLGLLDGVFVWLLGVLAGACCPSGSHAFIELLRRIPGLGVLVMLVALLLTGVFATNVVGQWALRQGTGCSSSIPIVKSIYSSVQAGLRHAVLEQRQRLSRGGAGAVPARRRLDHRLRHRQARRRGGRAPAAATTSASTCRRRRTRPRASS